jgi:protein-tyrosine phosphatase
LHPPARRLDAISAEVTQSGPSAHSCPPAQGSGGGTFELVFICTGNRFRSALAESAVRASAGGLPVALRSFATMTLDALPVLEEAQAFARRFGLDVSEHRSRSLEGQNLGAADLVIGFELIHAATAVLRAGAARDRTFLLGELVDYLDTLEPPEEPDVVMRARGIVEAAAALRAQQPDVMAVPEIEDPYGKSAATYEQVASDVLKLTNRVSEILLGASPRAPIS